MAIPASSAVRGRCGPCCTWPCTAHVDGDVQATQGYPRQLGAPQEGCGSVTSFNELTHAVAAHKRSFHKGWTARARVTGRGGAGLSAPTESAVPRALFRVRGMCVAVCREAVRRRTKRVGLPELQPCQCMRAGYVYISTAPPWPDKGLMPHGGTSTMYMS